MKTASQTAQQDIIKHLHDLKVDIKYYVRSEYLFTKEQRRLNRQLKDLGYKNLDNRTNERSKWKK